MLGAILNRDKGLESDFGAGGCSRFYTNPYLPLIRHSQVHAVTTRFPSNHGMPANMTDDLSRPISILLREGTSQAHKSAESSPGAAWLARGELDKDEYVRYLMMLWHIYELVRHHSSRSVTVVDSWP